MQQEKHFLHRVCFINMEQVHVDQTVSEICLLKNVFDSKGGGLFGLIRIKRRLTEKGWMDIKNKKNC